MKTNRPIKNQPARKGHYAHVADFCLATAHYFAADLSCLATKYEMETAQETLELSRRIKAWAEKQAQLLSNLSTERSEQQSAIPQ